MTREERIKALERLKMEDAKWEQSTVAQMSAQVPMEIETLELPPLSIFLDAVSENATIQRAQSQIDQQQNALRMEKRGWMKWIRGNGMYSYGRYNVLSNASDEYTPMYQTTMASNQQTFNFGVSFGVTLDDILNRPLRLKSIKYNIDQLKYAQQELIEERQLRVLDAYNTVTEQLSTIKAKAESAALYNAQMKISEFNFIQGTIDIITLSLERGRRTGAVTTYEQSRVTLHNSIVLLEMLTGVEVIKKQ
jgi:outer membrane protein TolC